MGWRTVDENTGKELYQMNDWYTFDEIIERSKVSRRTLERMRGEGILLVSRKKPTLAKGAHIIHALKYQQPPTLSTYDSADRYLNVGGMR